VILLCSLIDWLGILPFEEKRMEFLLTYLTRLVVNDGAKFWLTKKASATVGREPRFLLMFITAAVIAGALGPWTFDRTFWTIAAVGFVQAFGTYCHWRAFDISMSKASLYAWPDDVFAMLLAVVYLKEVHVLNVPMALGILCSLGAMVLFMRSDAAKKNDAGKSNPRMLWLWILGYSGLWGGAFFSLKYFAVKEVPVLAFIQPWYLGAVLAAFIVCGIAVRGRAFKGIAALPAASLAISGALGIAILLSLVLTFSVLRLAPLVVAQPMFLVTESVIPALIGLLELKVLGFKLGFSEGQDYTLFDWMCFGLGVLGVCLIAIGYART